MRLSRKPRTLVITMLMAVFLLSLAGLAMALPVANWGSMSSSYPSNGVISGTVYDAQSQVYGTVYATIIDAVYGTRFTKTTPVITSQYIYGSGASFTLYLSQFTGLTVGNTYGVGLAVYESTYTPVSTAGMPLATNPSNTFTLKAPTSGSSSTTTSSDTSVTTGGSSGGSSGGGTTTGGTTASLPSVSASYGTPVSVTASKGAEIKAEGVTIAIPAGALGANVQVTVSEVVATAALAPAKGSALVSAILEITKSVSGDFSKPITLSMDFDPKKVDSDKVDVKICFFDEAKGSWTPLDNVKVDLTTGKVSGNVTHFTKFAVLTFPKEAKAAVLKDITGHWAEANIKKLVEAGAIAGYSDGSFKPNNNITRAEFATILVKALKLPAANGKVFADTANHWAKDSISAAAAAGIVNGYSATQFGPNDQITREQMAVMIAKAAKLAKANGKTFSDSAAISAWAKDSAASVSAAGVMSGYPDGSFKPVANATRAEAVTVIVKVMK